MEEKKLLTGISKEYIVQKSRPLIMASSIPYTIGQLKILDTYLSRINSHDPSSTVIVFPLKEYEQLLDVKRLDKSAMIKLLDEITAIKIITPYDGYKDGTLICCLFDGALLYRDEETDEWMIKLSCSELAKKLFFNIDSLGYVKYSLKNTIIMKSVYSIFLYQYLKDNVFRKTWKVDIDTLQNDVFHITSSYYKNSFQKFNQKILSTSVREIVEKTDLEVAYNTIYTKRKIQSIEFTATEKEEDPMEFFK